MTLVATTALALTLLGTQPPGAVAPEALARVRAYEQARIEVIDRLTPTVVCMFGKGNRAGGGSGVIIDPEGYGLTNFHVVAMMIKDRLGDGGLSDGKLHPFDVLGIDPGGDVAMFKLHGKQPYAYAPLGDSDAMRIGDYALAMGNPFLLAEDYFPTVTLGIISGMHRYQWGSGRALRYTDCIQVDTSINPGNSGGPLFDLAGNVIGINGRISLEERGRVNVGVGYAISVNQIKRFIPALRAGLPTKHATAGFTVFDRGKDVIVDQILNDSPAYEAGLRLSDAILTFGGADIRSRNRFASLLGTYPGGWPVEVTYRRKERVETIHFRLQHLPFPKSGGRAGAEGAPDPYAAHPVTERANARAVNRALHRYQSAVGGPEALAVVRMIASTGTRVLASRPTDTPTPLNEKDVRPDDPTPGVAGSAAAFERRVRWALLDPPLDVVEAGYHVIGGDEVGGRIAVVIEHKTPGATDFRVALDDETGALLRIEFRDPATRKRVRYEYDDRRGAGPMRLPHGRRLYLDDALYATDTFETIRVSSEAP